MKIQFSLIFALDEGSGLMVKHPLEKGDALRENTRSRRCECPAIIRLLRTLDNGGYITEHRVEHNNVMTPGEMLHWPSHKHIDVYMGDLVRAAGIIRGRALQWRQGG